MITVEHETSQLWMVSQVVQNQKASLDALQAGVLRAENAELKDLLLKTKNVGAPASTDVN